MATKAFQTLLDELGRFQGNVAGAERHVEKTKETYEAAQRTLENHKRDLAEIESAMRLIDPESADIFVEAVKQEES